MTGREEQGMAAAQSTPGETGDRDGTAHPSDDPNATGGDTIGENDCTSTRCSSARTRAAGRAFANKAENQVVKIESIDPEIQALGQPKPTAIQQLHDQFVRV